MSETQVTIRIDEEIWREFRAGCILGGLRAHTRVAQLIAKDIDSRKQESSVQSITKE